MRIYANVMLTVIAVLLGYIAIATNSIEAQTDKIELYTRNLRPPLSSFEHEP